MISFRNTFRLLLALAIALPLLVSCQRSERVREDSPATITAPGTGTVAMNAPAPSRDVCAMLSGDDVKSATGIEATGTPSTSGGADVCTWMAADGKAAVIQVYPTQERYDESRQAFESLYGTNAEDIAGIGERAFYVGGKTGVTETATVGAIKGSRPVTVQVLDVGGDPAALRRDATNLAHVLMSKM